MLYHRWHHVLTEHLASKSNFSADGGGFGGISSSPDMVVGRHENIDEDAIEFTRARS